MSGTVYQTSDALSAASYLSTLGTDTHVAYTDGGYANVQNIISELKYLGIDQVRDGISDGVGGAAPLSSYITMAKAGIHFTFIISGVSSNSGVLSQLSLMDQVAEAVPGSITAIEGPNEINNQPVDYNGQTGITGALAEQANIYTDVNADSHLPGVPVDYFTGYAAGAIPTGPDPSGTAGLADYDNQHPYPNFGEAPAFWVSRSQALGNTTNVNAPAVYTETGYTTNQVNATVQQVYSLDLLMDTAKEGISKTYLYELMDAYAPGSPQGDSGYGLYDYNNNAKPVATAIHNLTTLLQDSDTGFKTTPLKYSLSGLPADGNSMVIEKSDGTYAVVLWAEPQIWNDTTNTQVAAPSETVTLSLPSDYANISVYDPTTGTSAIATNNGHDSVTVTLTDHPIIIGLGNPVTSTPPPPPTPGTLILNLSEDAYLGDAKFTVSVDGTQIGGVQTVSASHAAGQSEGFAFTGNFAAGSHDVTVDFLNDAYAGTPTTDRNLYVDSMTLNGATTVENSAQNAAGSMTYSVKAAAPPAATNDTMVLNLSEDAYQGDAQFTVEVDGKQIGGVQTVTALHGSGQTEAFAFSGDFGSGAHTVAVDFLNDAYAGTPTTDRNLYVASITLNGGTTVENNAQNSAGTANYTVQAPEGSTTDNPGSAIAGSDLLVAGGGTSVMPGDIENVTSVTIDDNHSGGTAYNTNFTANSLDNLVITGGAGSDTITLGNSNQSVVTGSGITTVNATAADAGATIKNNGDPILNITTGGTAKLAATDTDLSVQLSSSTNLTLSKMGFITAIGSSGNDTINAAATNQTLTGGLGTDTLNGFSGFGDTFAGTAAGLNKDLINFFGGNDVIDVTNLAFASASASYSGSATAGVLSVTNATTSSSINLGSGSEFSKSSFTLSTDNHGGTLVHLG